MKTSFSFGLRRKRQWTENETGPKAKLSRKRNCPKNENTENETVPKLAYLQFRRPKRKQKRKTVGL